MIVLFVCDKRKILENTRRQRRYLYLRGFGRRSSVELPLYHIIASISRAPPVTQTINPYNDAKAAGPCSSRNRISVCPAILSRPTDTLSFTCARHDSRGSGRVLRARRWNARVPPCVPAGCFSAPIGGIGTGVPRVFLSKPASRSQTGRGCAAARVITYEK